MKKIFIISIVAICCGVNAQNITPSSAEIHPAVYAVIENYPPLQKGGYRIEKYSDEKYIVVGIGKAKITNSFSNMVRMAELDAELQIAKALNPTQITVETSRSKKTEISSSDGVRSQNSYKKFVEMLVSSHTPFITSCGFWRNGKNLYCARAVFVGDFNHFAQSTKLSSKITSFSAKESNNWLLDAVDKLPFLSNGGTILLKTDNFSYLVTVSIVPAKFPPSRRLIFGRNQAYKNMIAFISGGKLDQQLIAVTKKFSSSDGQSSFRQKKRKKLEASVKGNFQFIEPVANWIIPGTQSVFFLYSVKIDI